jgi:hypothetical protein
VTRRFTKGSWKIVGFVMSANRSKKVSVDEYYLPQTYPAAQRKKDCGLTREMVGRSYNELLVNLPVCHTI